MMSEFIVDPEDWPIEEIIKDQAYFDAAIRYAEEQGYSDLADAVHGLRVRETLLTAISEALRARVAEQKRQNELLRDACEDALLYLEEDYATFDFDAWRESWAKDGRLHFGEELMNKLKAAIDGGALDGEK